MTIVTPAGERLSLSADDELFWATAGGMGLTGVVVEATVRMTRVETAWVREDVERAENVDDCMARMEARDDEYRHSVAWIDCLARGRRLGRSVLLRGNHALSSELGPGVSVLERRRGLRLAAPPWMPNGLLRRETIAAFNEAYYRRAPRGGGGGGGGPRPLFFPPAGG